MGLTPLSFLQSDLDVFFGNFSPALKGTKPVVVSIDGGEQALSSPAVYDLKILTLQEYHRLH